MQIKPTPAKIFAVATLAVCALIVWRVVGHVWFRIDDSKVSINGKTLATYPGSDYSCFKSLRGDIFCYHQDHGTQFLISPRKREVSTIDESADVNYFEFVVFSDDFDRSGVKHTLPDQLTLGNGFVEFAPSVTEFKSPEPQRWRIYY
jgi:hypothetical protein